MNVLIACEFSGAVREEFRKRGHNAWSCDLLPTEIPGQHLQCSVLEVLDFGWDLMVAHPPCTRLCNSGVRWLAERNLWEEMEEAIEFFNALLDHPAIPKVSLENSIQHKHAREKIRKYDQIIHPWQFGHKEMKATCLWLKNLPALIPTDIVGPPPKEKNERKKWARVHNESPGPERWMNRSRTFQGIARAMAEQWG